MNSSLSHLPFNRYQFNVYSQNGEDGVIAELHKRLGLETGQDSWCVEFGAWDGMHLSNTFALVEQGWNAVYIEGDAGRYKDLQNTATRYPKIVPVCAFVARASTDEWSLNAILKKTRIPADFALLSIDIDSYDCDVWESLTGYAPKIVVIEINSSVPPGIVWRHSDKTPGNTFSATCNVARRKGYTLVCHTGNLIFVRDDLVAKLNIDQRYIDYPELLFQFDGIWVPENLFREPKPASAAVREFAIRLIPRQLLPVVKKVYKGLMERTSGLDRPDDVAGGLDVVPDRRRR
jgi:hypothetical protein